MTREVSGRWAIALLTIGGISGTIVGFAIGQVVDVVRLVLGG